MVNGDWRSAMAIGWRLVVVSAVWRERLGWWRWAHAGVRRQRETRVLVVMMEGEQGARNSLPVRWCCVRGGGVDLVCGRKDGSALALGMERALARGCGFGVGRFLDRNTEHRLVQRPLEAMGRAH